MEEERLEAWDKKEEVAAGKPASKAKRYPREKKRGCRNQTQLGIPRKLPMEEQEDFEGVEHLEKRVAPLIVGTTIWKKGGSIASSARYISEPRESTGKPIDVDRLRR